jgi:hypothetical protein
MTYNIWDNGKQPSDYEEKLSIGNFKNYIDKFHDSYLVIDFLPKETHWMQEAIRIGCITIYNDELMELLERLSYTEPLFKNERFFVRSSKCSLKTGKFEVGPYKSLKEIIVSMTTSSLSHNPTIY